jgi:tetratricopeptide (TPR) repeat protein
VIDESIFLYKEALKMKPSSASFILNLVHILELQLKYNEAMEETKKFLQYNPSLSIGKYITAKEVYDLISEAKSLHIKDNKEFRYGNNAIEFSNNWELQWISNEGSKLVPKGSIAEKWSKKEKEKYSQEELDLLALFFTVVKILYISGALSLLPKLISRLEEARVGNHLHETLIRNEHAYFCCISQIMTYLSKQLPLVDELNTRPLYVCGESHCLSPAWQIIQVGGEKRLLTPVLVTGLKCWHLRDASDFYPKANFEAAVHSIPNGEQVIFMFGEIDCREGIFFAVEKCRYKDLEEGINVAIDIYLKKLLAIQKEKDFDIYIHPVLPILDITRDTVKKFNQIMHAKLNLINNNITEKKRQLKWLSFFDQLLTPDKTKLRKDLELDGTHIHPKYVPLVEKALNKWM